MGEDGNLRMVLWALVVLVLSGAVGAFAVGWVMSNRFLVPQPYSLMPEFEIVTIEDYAIENDAIENNSAGDDGYFVTLPLEQQPSQFSDVRKEGVYNLLWEDGYGRLGPVLLDDDEQVVRRVVDIVGEAPKPGDPARLDVTIFRREPMEDHGIPFDELELEGAAGRLYAWWIDQDSNRAVLALHGRRRADRTETLRILPTLVDSGWSVLALAYRNHDLSDASPDGLYHYGASEFEDALVGVAELARQGVEEVVLYGFSMGGAVALEVARRWPAYGPELAGIVLDSPLLDPREVIRKGARDAGLPLANMVADLSLVVARLRTGVQWDSLDQRRSADEIDVPLLLIAGTADSTVPIELVDGFAGRVEAPLEYLRLEGVDHVEGWNRARPRYEQAVEDFLGRVSEGEQHTESGD
ncbi:MAG: alpha/beta fold hydrolase [Trueperaceae bacterium]